MVLCITQMAQYLKEFFIMAALMGMEKNITQMARHTKGNM